ncbi:hypothetical protein BGZ80_005367 [Entomortierella chlamydospora]|uniref:Major facilitator superfamily (MFS) profile domain-containing protein n=1 Tax=Entomortierella chlamydospora TaxID=101097 RepID=A0A9P6SUZ6_9FUNG|nr:hypothetical protein BGZ79_001335 [Entomortierella chlamydospora]KAG0005975.1 hypothetical protein BGZ80_005367 [Entomortierella chlamydospora]
MSSPPDIPQIRTTDTDTHTSTAAENTPDYYATTTTGNRDNDDDDYDDDEKGQYHYIDKSYHSLPDDGEVLQPNQRRAMDSHEANHDSLASTSLGLAFSDPMLAITQLPNAGRRSSIASSLHSNASSLRRQRLFQSSYPTVDEKKAPVQEPRKSQEAGLGSVREEGIPTDRQLEAFTMPDLPEVDDGSPPMDSSWYGYVIVVCCFIVYFIVFGTEHTFGVYQEFYTSSSAEPFLQGATSQQIAMIGTLATTFTYLLGAFSGRFADRAGFRISTILGAVIMGTGFIGASFTKSIAGLYICQGVILGVGSSLVYLPAISCPAHWFEKYRSIAIGVVVCGSGLGGLVLGPLVEYLIARLGIHWTLRIQGLLCLVGIGGSGMMLKTRVKKVAGQSKRIPMDFTICKEVPFITLTLANFLTSLGYMIPFFFLSSKSCVDMTVPFVFITVFQCN